MVFLANFPESIKPYGQINVPESIKPYGQINVNLENIKYSFFLNNSI